MVHSERVGADADRMNELKLHVLGKSVCIVDLGMMAVALGAGLVLSGQLTGSQHLSEFLAVRVKLVNFGFFIAFAVVWHLIFKMLGLCRTDRVLLLSKEWWGITKAVFFGTLLVSGLAPIFDFSAVNRVFLVTFFGVALIGTIAVRTILRALLGTTGRNGRNLRNLVIVGCGKRGMEIGKEVRKKPELGYLLLGYIDDIDPPENPLHGNPEHLLGDPGRFRDILMNEEVDEVLITLPIKSCYETIARLIELSAEMGIGVRVPADFFDSRLVYSSTGGFGGAPMLTLDSHGRQPAGAFVKRLLDVAGSVAALVVLGPVLAVVALAVKLDSRGPVFFVQDRVGLGSRVFKMFKFRTMRVDAESCLEELESQNEVKGAAFKMSKDPRITRVGRVLRKLSLDELPQFFNVLSGEMSLVGPRPLPIRDVERFDNEWQKRRFSVKPGLTCLWQINGRHKIDFEQWMELDLQYIDSWSLSLDVDILLKTLPAAIRGSGAS